MTIIFLKKENRYINLKLLGNLFGPINSELGFKMFCSVINIKKTDFFRIVTVQDWSKTSLALGVRPLKTLNCFECYRSR